MAQITGLSAALIRAWEARYNLVVPARTAAGYRLYSDEDVAVLQGAQRMLQKGMAPMQAAALPRQQLREQGEQAAVLAPSFLPAVTPASSVTPPPVTEPLQLAPGPSSMAPRVWPQALEVSQLGTGSMVPTPTSFAERVDRLIAAFAAFDNQQAEQLLGPPMLLLPPEVACRELLLPLVREGGERWHRGVLAVAAEHFGSHLLLTRLKSLIETLRFRTRPDARRMVVACAPGELHELGLLMFTLEATAQGWDMIYLGASLPVADLAQAVRQIRPDLVGVSFVTRREPEDLGRLLDEMQQAAGGRRVLVGGCGIVGHTELVRNSGCLMLPESGRLDDLLSLRSN